MASPAHLQPTDPARDGRRLSSNWGAIAAGIALAIALAIFHQTVDHRGMIDLEVYRKGAWALLHHRNPFSTHLPGPKLPYTYTPFSTIVFVPLAVLSLKVAIGVHTCVSLIALFVVCCILARHVDDVAVHPSRWLGLAVLLTLATYGSEPVLQTLGFGQVNLVLMAMILVDLAVLSNRRGGGVLLGIATGIKLTPLVFILYLVIQRRFRLATTAAVADVATVLVGAASLPRPSVEYFTRLMWDARRVGNVNYVGNQSLNGMWVRLFRSYPASRHVLELSAAIVLALGLWTAMRARERFGDLPGIAVCAVTGLLVSPISWSHHWVWWMLPAVLLLKAAWDHRSGWLALAAVAWTVPFYAGPFWFVPHKNHRDYPHGFVQQVQASTYVWLALAALVVTAILLRKPRSPALPADDTDRTMSATAS